MKFLVVLMLGFTLWGQDQKPPESFYYLKDYPRVLHFIETSYLDKEFPDRMIYNSFQSMLWSVSERYNLTTEKPICQDWEKELMDSFGLRIVREDSLPYVVSVAVGSPAFFAGLESGDILTRVNQKGTFRMNSYEMACDMLQAGETVLELRHTNTLFPNHHSVHLLPEKWKKDLPENLCDESLDNLVLVQELNIQNNSSETLNKPILLDMTTCTIQSEAELLEWVSRFLPNVNKIFKSNKSGEVKELDIPKREPLIQDQLYVWINGSVSGWEEIFCHLAKAEGCIFLGVETAAFPYEMKWLELSEPYYLQLAYWQFGLKQDGVFQDAVQPDIRLPRPDPKMSDIKIALKEILEY